MAFLPTNASQVQQWAGALYGITVGSATLAQVNADITAVGGLNNALNAYYKVSFGATPTATVATTIATNLGLTGAAKDAAAAYITGQLNNTAADARGAAVNTMLNLFLSLTGDATFGAAATAWAQTVEKAVNYTGTANQTIGTTAAAPTGQIFTLTTDVDGFTGTAGDDTFKAVQNDDGTTNRSTFQTGDILVGGAGADTLDLTVADDNGSTPLVEISGIETVKIRDLSGSTVDASLWSDVTRIETNKSLDWTSVDEVPNAVVIAMTNSKDYGLEITYADDALGSDEYEQFFELTNVSDAATGQIDVHLDAGGDDAVTAINVKATGANFIELGGGSAYGDIEKVTVTGDGSLDISEHGSSFDDATTVDLSANTGGVTIPVGNEDVVVTGGSGDDVVLLSNATALTDAAGIALGAGDDALLDDGSAGVGTDAVLDGGDGTDTIASTLLVVGNRANYKGWEVLDIANDARTLDASLFTSSTFNSLAKTGGLAGNMTITKLAGTQIVIDDTSASNDGDTLTATLATATGTADSAAINFNGDGSSTMANFTTAGLESISIDSQSENDGDTNAITVITTTDNVLAKITITGDKDFTLGGVTVNTAATPTSVTAVATTTAAALTLIDGSAATGDLTITAGASATTNNLTMTFNSLTIKTGEGDDTVSIGGRGTVEAGEGADIVNVAVLGVSVNVGVDEDLDAVVLAATADYSTATTSSTRFTTISNLATDDTIDFSALENTETVVEDYTADALLLGSLESAIQDFIDNGAEAVGFFNWVDGNTYIVVDGSDNTVIKLVGEYADFALAAGVITIG